MNYIRSPQERNFPNEMNKFKLEILEEIRKINEKLEELEQLIQGDPE